MAPSRESRGRNQVPVPRRNLIISNRIIRRERCPNVRKTCTGLQNRPWHSKNKWNSERRRVNGERRKSIVRRNVGARTRTNSDPRRRRKEEMSTGSSEMEPTVGTWCSAYNVLWREKKIVKPGIRKNQREETVNRICVEERSSVPVNTIQTT